MTSKELQVAYCESNIGSFDVRLFAKVNDILLIAMTRIPLSILVHDVLDVEIKILLLKLTVVSN